MFASFCERDRRGAGATTFDNDADDLATLRSCDDEAAPRHHIEQRTLACSAPGWSDRRRHELGVSNSN
jgi:hypothetical protein